MGFFSTTPCCARSVNLNTRFYIQNCRGTKPTNHCGSVSCMAWHKITELWNVSEPFVHGMHAAVKPWSPSPWWTRPTMSILNIRVRPDKSLWTAYTTSPNRRTNSNGLTAKKVVDQPPHLRDKWARTVFIAVYAIYTGSVIAFEDGVHTRLNTHFVWSSSCLWSGLSTQEKQTTALHLLRQVVKRHNYHRIP
jgi:hypothetical protein